jgi:Na+-transporting methylmalonyl-CoA/oxaloacetate decarboxylase gamma subunit
VEVARRLGRHKKKAGSLMKKLALMAMLVTLMLAFNTKAVMAQEKTKAEKAKPAPAQEKAKLQPVAKVLLENERVKVQEVVFKPGAVLIWI